MGRKEDQKARADQVRAEQEFILQKKMENLGIADFNHDIPPDEVDEHDVERTWYHAFKSMIPYTNSWYEARAAEEEMDGLKAIRVERKKAEDLLALAKNPKRSLEALDKLMSETNNDFHYFNRLMQTKMKEVDKDGKPKYVQPEPKRNPFRDAAGGKNRVKKAVKKPYQMIDEAALKSFETLSGAGKKGTDIEGYNPADEEASCSWRGKSSNGEWLKCTNLRQRHPYLVVYKPSGEETPKILKYCGYHQPKCIDIDVHEAEGDPPLLDPSNANMYGYCNLCLKTAKDVDTSIPSSTADTAPGVTPVDIALEAQKSAAAEAAKEDDKFQLHEGMICRWKPNQKESLTHVREYVCKNVIYRNPVTGALIPYCAMHAKGCVMDHGTDGGIIDVPNIYALCAMHHMALHKCEPSPVAFPYPGMVHKGAATAWRRRAGHWAAPKWKPMDVQHAKEFDVYAPEGLEHIKNQLQKVYNFTRIRIYGRRAALKIQSLWRKYVHHKRHLQLWHERQKVLRVNKSIIIQSQMRRFLGARRAGERRKMHLNFVMWISSHYRGYIYRQKQRRNKASRSISRFFKYIKSLKFKESVWMLIYIKRALKDKIEKSILIQKMVRGLLARRYVRSIFLYRFHCNYRARQIGRTLRKCMNRIRRSRVVRPPNEAIMHALVARRLGYMLTGISPGVQNYSFYSQIRIISSLLPNTNILQKCGGIVVGE